MEDPIGAIGKSLGDAWSFVAAPFVPAEEEQKQGQPQGNVRPFSEPQRPVGEQPWMPGARQNVQSQGGHAEASMDIAKLESDNRALMRDLCKATLAASTGKINSEADGVYTVEGFGGSQVVQVRPSRTVVDVVIRNCAGDGSGIRIEIKGFCNSLLVEGCVNVVVACDGVIEHCVCLKSQTAEFFVGGFAPPFRIESSDTIDLHMCTGTMIGLGLESRASSNVRFYTAPAKNRVGISASEIASLPPPPPVLLPSTLHILLNQDGAVTVPIPPPPTAHARYKVPCAKQQTPWEKSMATGGDPWVGTEEDDAPPPQGQMPQPSHTAPVDGTKKEAWVEELELSAAKKAALPFDAKAHHFYVAADDDELSFEEGDVLTIIAAAEEDGWVMARHKGKQGLAPLTHIALPSDSALPNVAAPRPQTDVKEEMRRKEDEAMEEMKSAVDRVLAQSAHAPSTNNFAISSPKAPEAPPFALKQPEQVFDLDQKERAHMMAQSTPPPAPVAKPCPARDGASGFEFTPEQAKAYFPLHVPAAWDYNPVEMDELEFKEGDLVHVIAPFEDDGWVVAENNGKRGIAPCPYLVKMEFPDLANAGATSEEEERRRKEEETMKMEEERMRMEEEKRKAEEEMQQRKVKEEEEGRRKREEEERKRIEEEERNRKEGEERKRMQEEESVSERDKEENLDNERLRREIEDAMKANGFSPAKADAKGSDEVGKGLVLDKAMEKLLPAECKAAWDFDAGGDDELSFKEGETLLLIEKDHDEGWMLAKKGAQKGIVPCTHLMNKLVPQTNTPVSTKAAAPTDARMEAVPRGAVEVPRGAVEQLPLLQDPVPEGEGLDLTPELERQLPLWTRAAYDYEAADDEEVSFKENDAVQILSKAQDEGWINAEVKGRRGLVPCTHLMKRVERTEEALVNPLKVAGGGGGGGGGGERNAIEQEEKRKKQEEEERRKAQEEGERRRRQEEEIRRKQEEEKIAKSKAEAKAKAEARKAEQEEAERKRREEEARKRKEEEEKAKAAAAAAAARAGEEDGNSGLTITGEMAKKMPFTVTAAWDFDTADPEEVAFKKGDKLTIVAMGEDEGWVFATLRGVKGLVPTTHFEPQIETAAATGGATGSGGGKPAVAEWDYEAQGDDELALKEGERISILGESEDEGWLNAQNAAGNRGLVPNTHIKML